MLRMDPSPCRRTSRTDPPAIPTTYRRRPDRSNLRGRRFPVVLLLFPLVVACGGDGTTGPDTTTVITSLTIDPGDFQLDVGSTIRLTATARTAGGAIGSPSLSWRSSDESIATVAPDGTVTGLTEGPVTITADAGGVTGSANGFVDLALTVSAAGGTLTSADGNVTLEFPPGAVSGDTRITIRRAPEYAGDPRVAAGAAYSFGPSGIRFDKPVRVTIRYGQLTGHQAEDASFLWLHRRVGSEWVPVPGLQADTVVRSVTGELDGFSDYGAVLSELAAEVRELRDKFVLFVASPAAESAIDVMRLVAGLLAKTDHPLFTPLVDPILDGLRATACQSYDSVIDIAQRTTINDYEMLSALTRPLLAWTGIVHAWEAECERPPGFLDALLETKFGEFTNFYIERLNRPDFTTDFDELIAEAKFVLGMRRQAELLGMEAINIRFREGAQVPLLSRLRESAYQACRTDALHRFLGTLRIETILLDDVPFEEQDLLDDVQYCATRLGWRVVDGEGETKSQGLLGGGSAPGSHTRQANAPGLATGHLELMQDVRAFRCADGSFADDVLVVSFEGVELRRLSAGPDGNFFAAPVQIPAQELIAAGEFDPEQAGTYTLAVERESTGCGGTYVLTVTDPYPLGSIALTYPADSDDPSDPPLDVSGKWSLVVSGVCVGEMEVTQAGAEFSVSGSVGGAFCPFSASGSGTGSLDGLSITFGIAFGTGVDEGGSGDGMVTFDGTIHPSGNQMSGTYDGGDGDGTWAATRIS